MRVAVDIRPLLDPVHSGVQEYTVNLLTALFKLGGGHEWVLFSSGTDDTIKSEAFNRVLKNTPAARRRHLKIPNRLINRSFQALGRPWLNKFLDEPDVFFAPNFGYWGLDPKTPVVVAVHDLSFLRYPEFFAWRGRAWARFVKPRRLAQRASHLIAMSESTKADLVALLGMAPEKVSVVYSGLLPQFRPVPRGYDKVQHVLKKYHLPGKYILSLGTLEPRKNLVGLIQAYELLYQHYWEGPRTSASTVRGKKESVPPLVLAGPPGWLFQETLRTVNASPFKQRILLPGPVSEPDRPFVYAAAKLFVYPSFFEGFGFPPLEAMACGIPVVTSRVSSIPEAVGTAALTIDPHRVNEITEAMKLLLADDLARKEFIAKGLERVKEFRWEKTARETLRILERAGNEKQKNKNEK